MIISRKRFEQEIEKVRCEMYKSQEDERRNENMWRAIYALEERVDRLEGKNQNEMERLRPVNH